MATGIADVTKVTEFEMRKLACVIGRAQFKLTSPSKWRTFARFGQRETTLLAEGGGGGPELFRTWKGSSMEKAVPCWSSWQPGYKKKKH